MSKSLLYTVNDATQDVAIDGIINLGTIVRKFGQNLNLAGNGIQVCGPGYYEFDVSITLEPDAAGTVTVTGYENNVPIQGAVASNTVATAADPTNLSLDFVVRQFCSCCESLSNITLKLSENAAAVTNIAVVAEKL